MSKFVLIDHSLKRPGGHHFDYALQVLQAAEAAGFEIVLATQRRFHDRSLLPKHWQVHPVFQIGTYNPYTIYCSEGGRLRTEKLLPPGPSWGERLSAWRWRRGRQKCVARFCQGCRLLFERLDLQAGDHVFLPTMSEVDLAGLTRFLHNTTGLEAADWHVQFHFNVFDGRDPDYDKQLARLLPLRREFAETAHRFSRYRVHFYNTTEPLTRQYNRLGGPHFSYLPYPVNPVFACAAASEPVERPRPLRITCGGAIRAEKNPTQVTGLLSELWADCFATGDLQLLVQTNKPRFRLPLPDSDFETASAKREHQPVVYVQHPLPPEDYVEFIRSAGVGVFYYDSERYYARHAGILGEFLAAGVPVIVPAGCWLAEQIAEPTFQHHRHLLRETSVVSRITCADPTEALSIPDAAGDVLLMFDWIEPSKAGAYLQVRVDQQNSVGKQIDSFASIVGHRPGHGSLSVLVHLAPGAKRLQVAWRNAYHAQPVAIANLQMTFLARGAAGENFPTGAVGLIAADADQAPHLLREIWQHYPHYRRTAQAYSQQWQGVHNARHTLEQLMRHEAPPLRLPQRRAG